MAAEPSYIFSAASDQEPSANQGTFRPEHGDALLTSFSLLLQHYGITKAKRCLRRVYRLRIAFRRNC